MASKTEERQLIGASPSEQEIFDSLIAHERNEQEVVDAYEAFAADTPSAAVRYLIGLIVEDERRHHQVLRELMNTIRAEASFEERGPRIPYLDVYQSDRDLLDQTRHFLAVERKDRAELKHLSRTMRHMGSGLDAFVVDLLRSDTERHLTILRFIEHLVRRSPLHARPAA